MLVVLGVLLIGMLGLSIALGIELITENKESDKEGKGDKKE